MTTSPERGDRPRPGLHAIWRDPGDLLAFGLGTGCAPRGPGTVGTLAGVALYAMLPTMPLAAYVLLCLVAFGLGCLICDRTARRLGVHDHPGIVLDEVVGYLVTMAPCWALTEGLGRPGLPGDDWLGTIGAGWLWAGVGFGLFRLFDIWKPWPVGLLDRRLEGGFGIMADDVAAAGWAMLCLGALLHASTTLLP